MFGASVHDSWKAHALREFPLEACGLVVGTESGPVFVPCRNTSADPRTEFDVDPRDFAAASMRGDILAVLHSHTPNDEFSTGMAHPSKADMSGQEVSGLPWAISMCSGDSCSDPVYFGDQSPMRDLIGRPYIYGVWDCYSLIRDYYRTRSDRPFTLPYFPREDNWWSNGGDLYGENFAAAGFREIPVDDAREGDALVMTVRSRRPNHAAVLIGGGLMLHHLHDQLSGREPAVRWRPLVTYALRHEVDF